MEWACPLWYIVSNVRAEVFYIVWMLFKKRKIWKMLTLARKCKEGSEAVMAQNSGQLISFWLAQQKGTFLVQLLTSQNYRMFCFYFIKFTTLLQVA